MTTTATSRRSHSPELSPEIAALLQPHQNPTLSPMEQEPPRTFAPSNRRSSLRLLLRRVGSPEIAGASGPPPLDSSRSHRSNAAVRSVIGAPSRRLEPLPDGAPSARRPRGRPPGSRTGRGRGRAPRGTRAAATIVARESVCHQIVISSSPEPHVPDLSPTHEYSLSSLRSSPRARLAATENGFLYRFVCGESPESSTSSSRAPPPPPPPSRPR